LSPSPATKNSKGSELSAKEEDVREDQMQAGLSQSLILHNLAGSEDDVIVVDFAYVHATTKLSPATLNSENRARFVSRSERAPSVHYTPDSERSHQNSSDDVIDLGYFDAQLAAKSLTQGSSRKGGEKAAAASCNGVYP
jgi:hypothetical protein